MTDNEIIKALERLHKRILQSKCAEEITETEIMGLVNALDLINRQKAEILELQKRIINWRADMDYRPDEIKSEAIKEFADRLKEKKYKSCEWSHGEHPYIVEECDIDNLVKEMTEVNENDRT